LWTCYFAVAQTANFTYTPIGNSYCAPATINFTSQASSIPVGYLWNFGNGQKSNQANPKIIFRAGTYRVHLVIVYEKTTASITKEIIIKPTDAVSLSSNKEKLCSPGTVIFTANTSSTPSNFQWDFGDNSSIQNTTVPQLSHNFNTNGNFTTSVTFSNTSGCKSKSTLNIQIKKPEISAAYTNADGCVPATNNFNAVVSVINNSPIATYSWNFGDGNIISTQQSNISHIYGTSGNYSPKLSITTTDGCTAAFDFDSVRYGTPPTNLMAYPALQTFCGSERVHFIAKADLANEYNWMFGNNNPIAVNDTITTHKFSSLGNKTIKVTSKQNNCPGDTISMVVNVIGAIAKFSYQNTCDDKKTFQFNNTSSGRRLTYSWDFGDGTTSNSPNPTNTFPRRGAFNTMLKVTDTYSGCVDSANITIYTAVPILLNSARSICINSNTIFRIMNNYSNSDASQTWYLMNNLIGPNTDSFQNVLATRLGYYNNYVVIDNGSSYCADTLFLDHQILVKGPNVNFTADNNNCLNQPVGIYNLSSSYLPGDVINSFIWNFGDSSALINAIQPRFYNYPKEGNYTISLAAIDNNGCKDTLSKNIDVRPMPFIWIMPRDAVYCSGNSDTLIGYTSDDILWRTTIPIQGLCNNCDSSFITAAHSASIYATVKNSYNCISSDSIYIKVFEPFSATANPDKVYVCEKQSATLQVGPPNKKVIWAPILELDNPLSYSPVVSTSATRTYLATLTDSAGCFSSSKEITVNLKSNAEVDLPSTVFLPYNANYTITPTYSNNIVSALWSPAIGLNCSTCMFPQTIIDDTKTYSLKATTDSGCFITKTITLVVECNNAYLLMPTAFTPNNDGTNDLYYPLSHGIKHIKRFAIFNRASQLVFERRNFTPNEKPFGWDGKFKNADQPMGTYIYVIEADCDLGQTTFKKGSLILIR